MKKGCKYITLSQRRTIENALRDGANIKTIAEEIGMSERTVYREIERGRCTQRKRVYDIYGDFKEYRYFTIYSADIAESKFRFNMTSKGRPLKLGNDYDFVRYMDKRVAKDKISPRAVLGEISRGVVKFKTKISKTTLYNYIRMGLFPHIAMTSEPKKAEKSRVTVKRAPRGTSIEQRPQEIMSRDEFGHWEMDCICGPTSTVILNLTERRTRKIIAFIMGNQKACSVVRCLNKLERQFGKDFKRIFKSITVDNGSEFSNCKGMERSIFNKKSNRTKVYYCHPYSAYERGTNERMNREVRRLIPKGTDLSQYDNAQLQAVVKWVNTYPREIFGYATSQEQFAEEMAALGLFA